MPKVLVFAAIISIVLLSFSYYLLQIKRVEFESNTCPNDRDLIQEKIVGRNILLFNSDNFVDDLKPQFSCIDTFTIKKKYPSSVTVDITTQTAIANIEGTNYQVSKNGLIWEKSTQNILPMIFLPSEVSVNLGQYIQDKRVLIALDITSSLLKSDFVPTSIKFVDYVDIVIYDSSQTTVIFSGEKGTEEQVDSLQLILSKAKIDELNFTKIDLRFDKPVISAK